MSSGKREYGQEETPALDPSDWRNVTGKGRLTNRAERAAQVIAESIKSVGSGGRLGTKDALRIQCGVSIGTLNEAIRLLQARGLVTVRPGRGGGLFATDPAPMVRLGNNMLALDSHMTSVSDAVRIRNALEVLVVEDAIAHANVADIARLQKKLADMAAAAQTSDGLAFLHANCELHAQLAATGPDPMLRSLYVGLLDVIEAHALAMVSADGETLPGSLLERYRVHARLIGAIAAQDSAEALGALAQHRTTSRLTAADRRWARSKHGELG